MVCGLRHERHRVCARSCRPLGPSPSQSQPHPPSPLRSPQLLEWMQNPVPASQMASALNCNPVTLTPPSACLCRYRRAPRVPAWLAGRSAGTPSLKGHAA